MNADRKIEYDKTGKSGKLKYKTTGDDCYRYQLLDCMNCDGEIRRCSDNKLLAEVKGNCLTVYPGFSWDGVTNFPDFKFAMEASLVHDALYQIIRKYCATRKPPLIECADPHFYCMVKKSCSPHTWQASGMYEAIRAYQTAGPSWKSWKGKLKGAFRGLLGAFKKQKFACK